MCARMAAVVAVLVSLFTVSGTAQAAPAHTGLVLSVRSADDLRVAWLGCGQDSTHPRPWQACRALAAAGASIANMQADERPCPFIYDPVEARMSGVWRGRWVNELRTFSNSCVMKAHTGPVFDF